MMVFPKNHMCHGQNMVDVYGQYGPSIPCHRNPRDSWHSSTPERCPASPRYMATPPGRTEVKKWLEPNGSKN